MKGILFLGIFLLPQINAHAQTKADYEHAVNKLMQYYNNSQADSVYALLSDKWGDDKKKLYSADNAKALKDQYGKIISCKYIGKDPEYYDDQLNPMVFFRVLYTKQVNGRSAHAMSISLDEHNKIYGFNFMTSSPHIDSFVFKKAAPSHHTIKK